MVDLTPLDKLTRKRNSLLQNQLEVRLQIIQEEYRMTKNELKKNSQDVGYFLMGIQHTAPGLSTYGQPNTRAMNAKTVVLERKYHSNDPGGGVGSEGRGNKRGSMSGETLAKKGGKGRLKDRGVDSEMENCSTPPTGTGSLRNEFFNRKITLDSKRRSFLQHSTEPGPTAGGLLGGARVGANSPEVGRRGAISHTGFLPSSETVVEARLAPSRRAMSAGSQRIRPGRYGRDAYSTDEEFLHNHVMGRFDVIFDPRNKKPQGKIRPNIPAATPIVVVRAVDGSSSYTGNTVNNYQITPSNAANTSSYILNQRVTWSAPPKRREEPITTVAECNRSGPSTQPRPHSIYASHEPPRALYASHEPRAQIERRGDSGGGGGADRRVSLSGAATRPKTAPANYELLQRNMAASRQQVAGILAEVQSRRAHTRAMLGKSLQLKLMVKLLAPVQKQKLNEPFSD